VRRGRCFLFVRRTVYGVIRSCVCSFKGHTHTHIVQQYRRQQNKLTSTSLQVYKHKQVHQAQASTPSTSSLIFSCVDTTHPPTHPHTPHHTLSLPFPRTAIAKRKEKEKEKRFDSIPFKVCFRQF
jgi:hypothetical protein